MNTTAQVTRKTNEEIRQVSADFDKLINKFVADFNALKDKHNVPNTGLFVPIKWQERGKRMLGIQMNAEDFYIK